MNVLNRLTIKNWKLNRKRAIGTIIGIILSVALICAVSNMVNSFRETLVQNAINETGYYHVELEGITKTDLEKLELNKDIKSINVLYTLGYSYIDLKDDEYPYIEFYSLEQNRFSQLSYQVMEGRLPNNNGEIVISNKIKLESNYKVGDTITLNIGSRKTSDGFILNDKNPYLEANDEIIENPISKTYKIVGIVYKEIVDNNYYGITINEKTDNINAYISLKNPRDYENSLVEMLGTNSYEEVESHNIKDIKYNYDINNELLRLEAFKFSDSTLSMLTSVATVVFSTIYFNII